MKANKKIVARMLKDTAEKIDNGSCGLDEEELIALCSMFLHRKINIEQTCQHFGVSRATLNRWQQCGKLPPFHKDCGGKDYLWLDEAEEYVEAWNKSNGA